MKDIVTRLGTWVHAVHAVPVSDLLDEAADEIERLRNGSLVVCETVRLTDEEREAVAYFAEWGTWTAAAAHAATLRGLLERL
jgi:3-phosphoglycerate kinase